MIKTFQIEYVRAVINYYLKKNRDNTDYFSDLDVSLYSFYEHLTTDDEINRYVELYKQLLQEQNHQDMIGVGILSITDSPNIMNIKTSFITPFEWGGVIRTNLYNRDKMLETLYKLLTEAKGKCYDVAQFDNGKLFVVGTPTRDNLFLQSGDYVGDLENSTKTVMQLLSVFLSQTLINTYPEYVYASNNGKLYEYTKVVDENNIVSYVLNDDSDIPQHNSFEKYCVSLSFDDIKVNQPYVLNAEDYCEITFGGSGTLASHSVMLGNKLTKVGIYKKKIEGETDYNFSTITHYYLDPLELPSGNSLSDIDTLLKSNNFISKNHNQSMTLTLNYAFILDTDVALIKEWFMFSRYGISARDSGGNFTSETITPNLIYHINEFIACWGVVNINGFDAKISGNIEIENSESDVLTIKVPMQIQEMGESK